MVASPGGGEEEDGFPAGGGAGGRGGGQGQAAWGGHCSGEGTDSSQLSRDPHRQRSHGSVQCNTTALLASMFVRVQ